MYLPPDSAGNSGVRTDGSEVGQSRLFARRAQVHPGRKAEIGADARVARAARLPLRTAIADGEQRLCGFLPGVAGRSGRDRDQAVVLLKRFAFYAPRVNDLFLFADHACRSDCACYSPSKWQQHDS